MGRWSEHVMGGDQPLDYEVEIARWCGVRCTPSGQWGFSAEILNNHLQQLTEHAESRHRVFQLVLGWLILKYSAKMPGSTRKMVLQAIDYDLGSFEGSDREERRCHMGEFRRVVEVYPEEGCKIELEDDVGLLGKYLEGVAQQDGP